VVINTAIKLLALTDIHDKISLLTSILDSVLKEKEVDLITVSGDVSDFGVIEDVERVLRIIDRTGIPFCYILGNCDPMEARNGVKVGGRCMELICETFSGIKIIGAGGATPTPFSTPFEVSENELVGNITQVISECCGSNCTEPLMLLTHNPPRGEVVDRLRTGLHAGSKKLRDLILQSSPLLVQCGHIHEAPGVERIGRSTVFNPGPVFRGRYAIVGIEDENVNVALGTI
jgi:Icc-related predicted phosphoesterase